MSCLECDRALSEVWHGIYRSGCMGCTARAAARSYAAFDALHPNGSGDPNALRDLVRRVLPGVPTADARRAVGDWWRRDHQDQLSLIPAGSTS